jgi:hypothetical protein
MTTYLATLERQGADPEIILAVINELKMDQEEVSRLTQIVLEQLDQKRDK